MPRIPHGQVSTYRKRLPAGTGAIQRADICRTSPDQRYGDRSSGDDDAARYLTGPQLCARYSISDMTLWRWLQDAEIGFPRPAMRVRERRYWLESDLVAWERTQLPRGDDFVSKAQRSADLETEKQEPRGPRGPRVCCVVDLVPLPHDPRLRNGIWSHYDRSARCDARLRCAT
jgi:predicted DNA-binding transcriptional regulator AlpA